jgi:hypothetical protein
MISGSTVSSWIAALPRLAQTTSQRKRAQSSLSKSIRVYLCYPWLTPDSALGFATTPSTIPIGKWGPAPFSSPSEEPTFSRYETLNLSISSDCTAVER